MAANEKDPVSPIPRESRDEAFDDLDKCKLKENEFGWVEKTAKGWIARISER